MRSSSVSSAGDMGASAQGRRFAAAPPGSWANPQSIPTNSWSSRGLSAPGMLRPAAPWSGVRHDLVRAEEEEQAAGIPTDPGFTMAHCNQVVMLTCLHLQHEMALREVGAYAWTTPNPKDAAGSMMRIMKNYGAQMQVMDPIAQVHVRAVPDPSKRLIQHHLQRARAAAGPDRYVAVVYSGHGIQEPPTEAGELWCYDKSFEESAADGSGPSEYIPVLLFDVLTWAGASTCYVWDCQHAGRFIQAAKTEAAEIDSQLRAAALQNPSIGEMHPPVYAKRQIHLAACAANQVIPKIPGMPDDVFTACLTSPTQISLIYHNLQTFPLTTSGDKSHYIQRSPAYMSALWDNMSLDLKWRLWSELEAILHTIAWQTMASADYHTLFGQNGDVVANMAGGFLLAQRVLGTYRTQPESIPHIPSSTSHPLWTHWDLILDNLFEQLPDYFDTSVVDTSWEADLKLVSFMEDQLGSILQSNLGIGVPDFSDQGSQAALSRLPIICQAASTEQFRQTASSALTACLQNLDLRGLDKAVNCGTLDVSMQLLALEDPSISSQMIGIWASLIRHPACVRRLAQPIKDGETLEESSTLFFFLNELETSLSGLNVAADCHESRNKVIQTAAILSTIINYVGKRRAPALKLKVLKLASAMLNEYGDLVQQWGALFAAEMLGCLEKEEDQVGEVLRELQDQLFVLVSSKTVETRATAIYALSRFMPVLPAKNLSDIRDSVDLAIKLIPLRAVDASLPVRKELASLFTKAIKLAGRWGKFLIWTYVTERAMDQQDQADETNSVNAYRAIAARAKPAQEDVELLRKLERVLWSFARLVQDPDRSTKSLSAKQLECLTDDMAAEQDKEAWTQLLSAAFPRHRDTGIFPDDSVRKALAIGSAFVDREFQSSKPIGPSAIRLSKDLFQRSKLALQAYIVKDTARETVPEYMRGQPQSTSEKTWIMRHRVLEDSLVLAEQQMGLPWKWRMKDITSPDPWSKITCHSFDSAVMSCNNTDEVLLWDWASSRKTGTIKLELAPADYIKSARFVNELHPTVVVLAEISNGDIYVFAGPPDQPTKMRPISSFTALECDHAGMSLPNGRHAGLITTWWRQSGLLAVGGPSRLINVWDCPAERKVRAWRTEEDVPCTSLITEPKQGNLFLGGFANGMVKLYDQRQAKDSAILEWRADVPGEGVPKGILSGQPILNTGIVLGESRNFTSACANGLINIHDLRNLSRPACSTLVQPTGMVSASFQAHSGLMSTISPLIDSSSPTSAGQNGIGAKPSARWGIYRSIYSATVPVTEEIVGFDHQQPDVLHGGMGNPFQPYTFIHPLRPFLAIGYGRNCYMRGSGIGQGHDTDSGSYSFLKRQTKLAAMERAM